MHMSFRQCRRVVVAENVIEDFVKKFVFTLAVLAALVAHVDGRAACCEHAECQK